MRIWEEVAGRCLHGKPEIVFKVRSADRTPWQAIPRLQRGWPKPIFVVQPRSGRF